jgi:hypothetical protein
MIPPNAQLVKYFAEKGSILPKGKLFSFVAIVAIFDQLIKVVDWSNGRLTYVKYMPRYQSRQLVENARVT